MRFLLHFEYFKLKKIKKIKFIAKSIKKKKFIAQASTVYNINFIKIKKSDVFRKNRTKFKTYITQCEFYLNFNENRMLNDKKKVL